MNPKIAFRLFCGSPSNFTLKEPEVFFATPLRDEAKIKESNVFSLVICKGTGAVLTCQGQKACFLNFE
jgi:hypothetical protein